MSAATRYPAATLAKLFNLTERRIQQLAKEGIIPKAERGQYDLIAAVRSYVHYLQTRAQGRLEGQYTDSADLQRERRRLIKAQADKTESETHKLRGALVPLMLVEEVLKEVAVLYSAGVDALPGRLANELAGLSDPAAIKTRLYDECRRLRRTTADHLQRLADACARGEASGAISGSADATDTG